MEDQHATSLADVVAMTPAVSAKSVDSGDSGFFARGFRVTNMQVDGVPSTLAGDSSSYADRMGQSLDDLAIYERVEIVRGATGLLSGSGSPAASINLVRKHADGKVLTGVFDMSAGSWGRQSGTADLTAPLSADGSVRVRLVARSDELHDPYFDIGQTTKRVLYGVIDADLMPGTRLSTGISEQRSKQKGMPWSGLPIWFSDGSRTDWERSRHTSAWWNRHEMDHRNAFVSLDHRLSERWQLRASVSSDQRMDSQRQLWMYGSADKASGEGLETFVGRYDTKQTQNDASVQAFGLIDFFGRTHELNAGINWSRNERRLLATDATSSVDAGNFYQWNGGTAEPAWGAPYLGSSGETTQLGSYAVMRWDVADHVKVISGGRLTRWRKVNHQSAWGRDYEIRHSVVTPYAGVVVGISDHASVYASYTSIFEPQNNRDKGGSYLDPLVGNAYEAGIKSELLGGKLQANAAVFRIDQDNLAQPDGSNLVPNSDREQAYVAAKGARTTGYELEVIGSPFPGWSLGGGPTFARRLPTATQ